MVFEVTPILDEPEPKYRPDWRKFSRAVKEDRGGKCEQCGQQGNRPKNPLTVHHLNYDSRDDRMENLKVLCAVCHLKYQHADRIGAHSPDQMEMDFSHGDAESAESRKNEGSEGTEPDRGIPVSDLRARFEKFHRDHPEIYTLFKQFALELRKTGRKNHSARDIIHRIRWDLEREIGQEEEGFKINDHLSPYYARMLMEENPEEFGEFFRCREVRG